MAATTLPITTKRPFLAWEVLLGQSPRSASGRKRCIIVSPQNNTPGTATANTIYPLPDAVTAATLGGYGNPAHRMRIAASEANRNVDWSVVFAADADVKTQATYTMAITGTTASESKVMSIRVGDTTVPCAVTFGDTPTIVGTAMVAAVNGDTSLPVTAAGTTTVTFTSKANGTLSTSIDLYVTDVAAGITVGTPIGTMTAGTGAPKWSAAYAAIEASSTHYDYIVPACATLAELNTGTGNLRDRIGADALAGVRKRMQVILGWKGTEGTGATFSSGFDTGTVAASEPGIRFSIVWFENGLVEEYVMAARWASQRCGLEEVDPNVCLGGFDGMVITGAVPPPAVLGDPLPADIESALGSGLSPVIYDQDAGTCRLVLSITCKDTTGGGDDYRAWTTNKITVCDYIADDLQTAEYDKYSGKKVVSDNASGDPENLPKNCTTPSLIGDFVCDRLNSVHAAAGLIEQVPRSAVVVERNATVPSRVDQWADVEVVPWPLQFAGEIHEVSP